MTIELDQFWTTLPTTTQHYSAGQQLAETTAEHSPIIRRVIQGRVKITASIMGEHRLLGLVGAGYFLGLRSTMISQHTNLLTWTADAETSAEEISWHALKPYLAKHSSALPMLQHEARKTIYQLLVAMYPQFGGITANDKATLMEHTFVRLLSHGEKLISQGGEKPNLYLIISGQLGIYQNNKLIRYRESGEIVGEISIFGFSQSPTADVISNGNTEILELSTQAMLKITRGNLPIRQWLAHLCEQRFAEIASYTDTLQHPITSDHTF